MQCLRVLRNSAALSLRTTTPRTAARAAFSTGQARLSETYPYDGYKSPFAPSEQSTTKIPDFTKYKSGGSETSNKVFGYFMAGTMGVLSAAGAKAIVQGGVHLLLFSPLSAVLYLIYFDTPILYIYTLISGSAIEL